ncbi:hypothetical protein PH5382_00404 [Phaeobacter sp. CECT 5382]|uniref:hypothetical protein n=1 Tax=Phaeobacter sp. CECT 5382 TaxID=1712645 RepID=UPI0006D9C2D3|nr:hypothetical protein [Phaeobacter sp. CECT 5382]CUH86491.1 hypothetical protein PH5382_00404 [Phaeobacter sp. CECT 5382]
MLDKRMILISAATAACALGIGFLMQPSSSQSSATQGASQQGASPGGATLAEAVPQLPQDPALTLEKITLTSARDLRASQMAETRNSEFSRRAPNSACGMQARADAIPGALVALQVSAPCRGNERVTIHHQGMMFTATLDGQGRLDLTVPALASTAVIIVEPSSAVAAADAGTGVTPVAAPAGGAVAIAQVPDMGNVDRIVLQWSGNSGFEVHAREFGAQYGEPGHVWHGASAQQDGTQVGQVLRLGDHAQLAPRLVEVYSFQRGLSDGSGSIEISVEAEVTEINCGREISAQSLRLSAGRIQTRDLILDMPDCSATGDFLVLNNLVENLKIAAK